MSGWIEHRGRVAPVEGHVIVEVMMGGDDADTCWGRADAINWDLPEGEGRVSHWRLAPNAVNPATEMVGDLASDAAGSGARANVGKAPLELIPAMVFSEFQSERYRHAPRLPDAKVEWTKVLHLIGQFQMNDTGASPFALLIAALYEMGAEPGLWVECARVFDYGRKKYAAWNWAKGMAWSIPTGCALRHIVLGILAGEPNDAESGETHRGHVACNIVMLLWFVDHYREGDDRRRPPVVHTTPRLSDRS